MSMHALRCGCLWLLAAFIMLTCSATTALAQSLTSPEDDTFYALHKERDAAASSWRSKLGDEVFKGGRDPVKMCAYATEMAKLSETSFQETLGWLRQRQAEGKDIERFERTYLLWSNSADSDLMHQYDYCAKASFPDDSNAEMVQYVENLLNAYQRAKVEKAKAQAGNDRLYYLSRLQAMHTLLDETLSYMEILRNYGDDSDPRLAPLVAQYPQLKSEYDSLHQKYQAKVAPIADPGGKDKDAPFAYRPAPLPDLPDTEDAFLSSLTSLLLKASEPAMAAMKPVSRGDLATACAYARFGLVEISRLPPYIQSYIDKQTAIDADTVQIRAVQPQVDDLAAQGRNTVAAICERYRQSGDAQALYNAANAAHEAASARQDPAVDALNAAIIAGEKPKTCLAAKEVLAIVDQKMIALELIKVLVEPQAQKAGMAAYLTKISDIQDKTRGLLQQATKIEADTCTAPPIDMTLD